MTLTTTRSDGSVEHHITPSYPSEYDEIIIRHTPDEPTTFTVSCYINDDISDQFSFQTQQMSFEPISLLGRGESESLQGVSPTDDSDDPVQQRETIPASVKIAFESMGLSVVPRGTNWVEM